MTRAAPQAHRDRGIIRQDFDGLEIERAGLEGFDQLNGLGYASAVKAERRERLRPGKDLERRLDQDAEPAQAPDKQLRQIEARRVFHDLPPAPHLLSEAAHEADAEDEVAHSAVALAARSAETRRDRPAQGGAVPRERRIEGKMLAVPGKHGSDLFKRGSGQRREGQFAGVVFDDARQAPHGYRRASLRAE